MSWWSRRGEDKRAQRNVGAVLRDDRYVLPGTIVQDRRGQRWQAMMLSTVNTGYALWWREVDAQTFRPPTVDRQESALDGKRFPALDEMCGPVIVVSLPPRLFRHATSSPHSSTQ